MEIDIYHDELLTDLDFITPVHITVRCLHCQSFLKQWTEANLIFNKIPSKTIQINDVFLFQVNTDATSQIRFEDCVIGNMKGNTTIGVGLQTLMQTLEMLWY